jgi:nucleoside-diphosphate-sugar epimerase
MIGFAGPEKKLLIFGNGYSGRAIAALAAKNGYQTTITSRTQSGDGIVPFAAAHTAIQNATHIIATAAPDEQGDPVLARYTTEIATAKNLRYIGYLSTTGVYGNRDGAWVDEDTPLAPQSPRAQRRVAAEAAWCRLSRPDDGAASAAQSESGRALTLDIFRLAGIYGPGRSMFEDLRAGTARRVIKPGHLFGRIHVEDIAHGVLTAMRRPPTHTTTIFNFTDDEPAASADVVAEAARLLNLPPPTEIPFDLARQTMSPMALSFWSENRKVSNTKTKSALNLTWRYPTYREGLAAILSSER